jgi:hypothetical protein
MSDVRWLQDEALSNSYKSLSLHIPILATHFENVVYGRDLVNKSSRLLQELICMILISPLW